MPFARHPANKPSFPGSSDSTWLRSGNTARQVSGADYFLDLLDFDARKDNCDVVITGEVSIDEQTLAGKLPAAVA